MRGARTSSQAAEELRSALCDVVGCWPLLQLLPGMQLSEVTPDEGCTEAKGGPTVRYNETLDKRTSAAYSFLRLPVSGFDLTVRPARTSVYTQALGMPVLTQAAIVAMTKAFDFLFGFIVGAWSDNLSTRWGRRKPFVAVTFPIGLLSFFLLVYPIPFVSTAIGAQGSTSAPCAGIAADNATSCGALAACLREATSNGSLPTYTSMAASSGTSAGAGLAVWFAVFYFGYFFFTWTCSMIPYDALGMELTSDYNERVTLFGTKVLFQFFGYLMPNLCGLALSGVFGKDVLTLYAIQALILVTIGAVAMTVLLCLVTERPESKVAKPEDEQIPPVVALHRALSNEPYLRYLFIKMPLSLTSLLPVNMLSYYIRFGMRRENNAQIFFLINVVVIGSSFLATPIMWWLARRYGKRHVLLCNSAVEIFIYLGGFFIPPEIMPLPMLMIFGVGVGLGAVVSFMIMDSMLADCIDYDAMRTGRRAEAVYTVAETNLQQLVEVFGGTLPLCMMAAVGFENNGGCECGCGVKCTQSYHRWSCPGDIGYACTDDFDAALIFGDQARIAPCVVQSSDGVVWVVRFFMLGLPGLLFIWATLAASRYQITKTTHELIIAATEEFQSSGAAVDPLTNLPIERTHTTPQSIRLEHFWPSERMRAERAGSLSAGIRGPLTTRLAVWLSVLLIILVAAFATSGDAQGYTISLGAVVAASILALIPYDAARLRAAMASAGETAVGTA